MSRLILALLALVAASLVVACTSEVVREVEVPGETVVVEKEVVKEVPVEVVVEKEVVREVEVPGETVVVEKEVVKEVPVEVVVEKIVEVPGAAVVEIKEVEVATFAKFGEAPMLQQLALAGSLPPVEQRLPKEALGGSDPGDRALRRRLPHLLLHQPG